MPARRVRTAIAPLRPWRSQIFREVATLTAENVSLKQSLAEAAAKLEREKPDIMYGCYYFGGDSSRLYCPGCYDDKGKKHLMVNNNLLGWKCTVCRLFIPD